MGFKQSNHRTYNRANGIHFVSYLTAYKTWEILALFMQDYKKQLTESSKLCNEKLQKHPFQQWRK